MSITDPTLSNSGTAAKAYFDSLASRTDLTPEQIKALQGAKAGILEKIDALPEAQQEVFLATLEVDILEGGGLEHIDQMTPEEISKRLDTLVQASQEIVDLFADLAHAAGGDDVLGALLIEFANTTRKEALHQRLLAREGAKAEMEAQAGQTEKAAEQMRSGAGGAIGLSILGAAISGAGGGLGVKALTTTSGMGKLTRLFPETGTFLKTSTDPMAKSTMSNLFSQGLGGTGQLGQGGAGASSSFSQADAKRSEAVGQKDAATAEFIKGEGDVATDVQRNVDDLLKAIITFLKERNDAKTDQMSTVSRIAG